MTDASLVAADAVADSAADGDAGGWGLAGLRRGCGDATRRRQFRRRR